jgi:ABC-type multidrug transport system fused ATPase/permease subunit
MIDGEAYIGQQFHYSYHHIWRSFGVIVGMWFFFIFLTSLGFELRNSQSGSSVLLYKRGSEKKKRLDEERGNSSSTSPELALNKSVKQSTFTWNHLDYHVPFQGDKKQLLHQVFGYVKPGNLVALMGSSGAGKTTYDSLISGAVMNANPFLQVTGCPSSTQR